MLALNEKFAYILIILNYIISVLVSLDGLKFQRNSNKYHALKSHRKKVVYTVVPMKSLQEILFLFHLNIAISLVTTIPILNIILFPSTVFTCISVFLPYLVKPSQFLIGKLYFLLLLLLILYI